MVFSPVIGTRVTVTADPLPSRHSGLKFDERQGAAAALAAPKGATGKVVQISDDGEQFLIELSWNMPAVPGTNTKWWVWVQRQWLGRLFDCR